jgi:hypothetical protein
MSGRITAPIGIAGASRLKPYLLKIPPRLLFFIPLSKQQGREEHVSGKEGHKNYQEDLLHDCTPL